MIQALNIFSGGLPVYENEMNVQTLNSYGHVARVKKNFESLLVVASFLRVF